MQKVSKKSQAFNRPVRVIDDDVYAANHRDYCEVCGQPCSGGPHHIRSRGAGGSDEDSNLIQLCNRCHEKAQRNRLDADWLRRIVERRMKNKDLFGTLLT